MTTNSFRQVTLNRPLEYRTPSPPIAAIEPISPLPADCLREHGGTQLPSKRTYHQSIADSLDIAQIVTTSKIRDGAADPQGAMDSFASIALSTGLDIAPRRSSHQEQASGRSGMVFASGNDQKDRSAKRARSEKLPSPRSRRTSVVKSARPATSYGDTRIIEAELLLNFAQEARFSVPPPSHWKDSTHAASSTHAAISMNPTGRPFPSTGSKSERNGDATHDPEPPQYIIRDERSTTTKLSEQTCGESGFSTLGQAPHSAHRPSSSHHPGAMVPDGTSISERAAFDMPADEFAGTIDVNSSIRNAEIHYKEELSPRQQAQMQMAVQNTAIQSELNGTEARDGLATQYTHYPTFAPQMPENVGPGNPMCTASFQVGNDMSPDDPSVETSDSSQDVGTDITTSIVRPELGSEEIDTDPDAHAKTAEIAAPAVCAGCSFTRTIMNGEVDINSTSWISCDACKCWFHFACAGFKNEREVRSVDKYRCRKCKPIHGSTTYVRKSSRAHSSIDYAGLHQGVIKTSDDTPEHHYIQPIKEGTITFLPETFPRMRPELVTAEYFEQCHGWREPIVVPAAFNPQARFAVESSAPAASASAEKPFNVTATAGSAPEVWAFDGSESQYTPDHGQDALDMVMPQGLTVRKVAELYGPEEKVEVIDVKSQNGEGKKWNMRRWADYYESSGDKVVRNVISLEVSQSRLGRLIRRPQIVRDLDLQDSVWPTELQAKGEIPRVQFYCLMSVADCFTDFHIDFGGSSVFYHILKGKKTFFFIPPKEKHLKKYEEWCLSPAQNWTFLGGQTKECYRVDLSEGDTMLIPAGWIHAVWTPEDSLVIGGNFLTRLNYGMQLRIAQIEKATGVARKFRYPHFQKIHWYAAFRYLEEDPLPSTVKEQLQAGGVFRRERPSHYDFNDWGENSRSGPENYHTRYYSQAELEGLPDLVRYLLRTAMIDMGSITDGITAETRNAVKRSIPRGHGEPLDVVKDLAVWCAWKRGNETIPSWAYPDAVPEPEVAGKIGVAAQKKLDREAALQAPRRQSARMQSLQHSAPAHAQGKAQQKDPDPSNSAVDTADDDSMHDSIKRRVPESNPNNPYSTQSSASSKRREATSGTGSKPHRKIACESCRKRRRACKHKDFRSVVRPSQQAPDVDVDGDPSILPSPSSLQTSVLSDGVDVTEANQEFPPGGDSEVLARIDPSITMQQLMDLSPDAANLTDADRERLDQEMKYLLKHPGEIASTPKMLTHLSGAGLLRLEHRIAGGPVNGLSVLSLNAPHSRGRTKACNDCRKSKRRCIHDEHGNEDPVKAREATMPRPAAAHKRRKFDSEGNDIPSATKLRRSAGSPAHSWSHLPPDDKATDTQMAQRAPVANMGRPSSGQEVQYHPQQDTLSAFDQIQAAAAASIEEDDGPAGTNSVINSTGQSGTPENKPAPAMHSERTAVEPTPEIPTELSAPHAIATTPPESKEETMVGLPFNAQSQPASSLVSPPASEHQDAGRTPPPPPNITSPRHSPDQSSQQRYTPESHSRRASSSSANDLAEASESGRGISSGPTTMQKEISPMTTISTTGEDERREISLGGSAEKRKLRASMEGIADEESLRLIKELQAEEYGLRRRGRA